MGKSCRGNMGTGSRARTTPKMRYVTTLIQIAMETTQKIGITLAILREVAPLESH